MRLSIVTINLNNASGLEATLSSIAEQTFQDYELIVVDGLSQDNSSTVIESYSSIISKVISEKDKGIFDAHNKGIDHCSGDYILFLNSGDILADQHTLSRIFQRSLKGDIVYGDMLIDSGKERVAGRQPSVITLNFLYNATIWHPASLFKRDLFTRLGKYDIQFKIVADYEFILRAFFSRAHFQYVPEIFAVFFTDGISSDPAMMPLHYKERHLAQKMHYSKKQILWIRRMNLLKKGRRSFSKMLLFRFFQLRLHTGYYLNFFRRGAYNRI